MKDFLSFYLVGRDVVAPNIMESSQVIRRIRRSFAKFDLTPELIKVLALKYCYKKIFKGPHGELHCCNEYLLDFETDTRSLDRDSLIVLPELKGKGQTFCFTIEEMINIIQADVSRSSVIYEPVHGIYSIVKNFRFPVNPYSMRPFTRSELVSIVSQMAANTDTFPKGSEVVLVFLSGLSELFDKNQGRSAYQTTQLLLSFFESQGFVYREKFIKKTTENLSQWVKVAGVPYPHLPKAAHLWFLEHVFLGNVGNGEQDKVQKQGVE